ncbi:ArpU family transcriptional regulator [Niallia circulans]|uniref:ArpU family transcriptional regulator n=1 Tax=Niallia circulans TaxID=1397 RepID=A0A0J1L9V1_NIACI|nr:ArpU family phage packaging/lysis transcriptional regulator [Niallia circulans]KLV25710.1 ArpU family transcriptional regulator [Niallia circulans]
MQQLYFFPVFDERLVRSIVIKELKRYKALKVRLQNKEELEGIGIKEDLFIKVYDNDQINKLKVIQIERALNNSLDFDEKRIIELKYLQPYRENDVSIYMELGLQKNKYYEKKKSAIFQLAYSLGII